MAQLPAYAPIFLSGHDKHLVGVRRVVQPAVPAAGADWTVTVPGGVLWRVVGGSATFTTSATVANRNIGVRLTSMGVAIYQDLSTSNLTASLSTLVIYQTSGKYGLAALELGTDIVLMPSLWSSDGDTISSLTTAMAAGDQYSNINLLVEEVYETDIEMADVHETRERDRQELLRTLATR